MKPHETFSEHVAQLVTDVVPIADTPTQVQDTVRVRVFRCGWSRQRFYDLTLRENGEPVNWSGDLEMLCGGRRPSFFNLIRSGFSIEPVGE